MSYVTNNLMGDEKILYQAKIHWIIFLPAITTFLLALGLAIFGIFHEFNIFQIFSSGFLFITSLYLTAKAFIIKYATELVVTSKRVIAKFGLIQRQTTELNHSKVESINVDQSIIARIFGYGTLTVNGTGTCKTVIPDIDDPLTFRRKTMQTIDS